jgi:hypothetical protein
VEAETTLNNVALPKSLMSRNYIRNRMENFDNSVQPESPFMGSSEIKGYLLETAKWGKFLAIVGYIGTGLLVLLAFFMMFGLSSLSQFVEVSFPMGMLGFVYIIFAVLYFIPVNYLFQYSVKMKQGLIANDLQNITTGFRNLKSLFKFFGIFTIVILSLYVLILIITIPAAMFFMN